MISDTAVYGWQQRNGSIRCRWPRRGESCTSLRCIRGDRAALDVLLNDWAAQIRAAQPEPDSQRAISWPSVRHSQHGSGAALIRQRSVVQAHLGPPRNCRLAMQV